MRREIKFRGKSKIKNQWVFGSLIDYSPRDKTDIHHCTEQGCWFVNVIPETVGQYTGLKDKNGKEIYEGDIIRSAYREELYMVIYENGAFRVTTLKDNIKAYPLALHAHRQYVIGNIHEDYAKGN